MKAFAFLRRPALGLLALGCLLAAYTPAPPATILSGHIGHAPAGDSVRLRYNGRQAAAALSPAGDFRLALTGLQEPQRVTLTYEGQTTFLWLSPGDHQHLTLDFPKFDETVQYTGRGAAASNYLARALYRFAAGAPGQLSSPLDQLTPQTTATAFTQQEATYRRQRLAFLTTYAQAHPLPAAFVREQQQIIDLQWASELLLFPGVWHWKHHNGNSPQALSLPNSYFDFMRQVPLRQLAAHPTPTIEQELSQVLLVYGNRLLPSGHLSTDPAEASRLYAVATAELGATPTRDQAMYDLFAYQLLNDFAGVAAAYPTFRAQNRDSALAGQLRQKLAARRLLEPGQPAPDFSLRDNTGREVTLRDLRGKVVYLDFWGTWCPPCMEEMTQHSHALKERFVGQDVAFVYISVRDAEATWQRVLAKHQLTSANSVHLRAPDQATAERYQVAGYPSYYLIGRDGRFVQAYTTRPSDGAKTVAAIEAALHAQPTIGQAQR